MMPQKNDDDLIISPDIIKNSNVAKNTNTNDLGLLVWSVNVLQATVKAYGHIIIDNPASLPNVDSTLIIAE